MTAMEHACSVLVAEGFAPGETEEWLEQPDTRGMALQVYRQRRAAALSMNGLVETEKSARAGRMVRALLAVAGGA